MRKKPTRPEGYYKRIGLLGANKGGQVIADRYRKAYEENPKYCKQCNQIIPYDDRTCAKQFCNSSCSAKYNNSRRKHSEETKQKIKKKINSFFDKKPCVSRGTRKKTGKCVICGIEILSNRKGKLKQCCSSECLTKRLEASGHKGGRTTVKNGAAKRSKNEIYFSELCKNHFKDIKTNEPMFNGWDADVIIEDIKVAVLWNGKWHYQQMPMFNHNLQQVQNRDKIKLDEIKKCGYTPYIIKDMGSFDKRFVEEEFKKFISIAL